MGGKLSTKRKKKKENKEIKKRLQLTRKVDILETRIVYEEQYVHDKWESTNQEGKRYDPRDRTLTFVTGNDDLDFLLNEYEGPRAKLSCGHACTPMSLTDWCRRLLDEGECKFVCGQTNCNVEWPFEEVRKMALLTPEELKYFEKTIFKNAARDFLHIKSCPGCWSRVLRRDLDNLNVQCNVCTARRNTAYRFCWQCLREWKGPAPRSDRCDNDGCQSTVEILKHCPIIDFDSVKVKGCPTTRACPTCGKLVEHNKKQCKTMVCPRCNVKFCFVCLGFGQCLQRGQYENCPTGVAPRQTSIPVWNGK